MKGDEEVKCFIYGDCVTVAQLAKAYGVCAGVMRVHLGRSEFQKWSVANIRPAVFKWNLIFERDLDNWMAKKGKYRCIDSKVPCKYTLEKESLS